MKNQACPSAMLFSVCWVAIWGVIVMAPAGAVDVKAPRARDLGIPFDGEPGPLNAITDVAGVQVGHTTLVASPAPKIEVRTGVTAILPRLAHSARSR